MITHPGTGGDAKRCISLGPEDILQLASDRLQFLRRM